MAHAIVENWFVIPIIALIATTIAVRISGRRAWLIALGVTLVPSLIAWACTSFDRGSLYNLGAAVGAAGLLGFFHPELLESFRGWLRQPRIAGFLVQVTAVIAVLIFTPQIALAQLIFCLVIYHVLKTTFFPKKSREQN